MPNLSAAEPETVSLSIGAVPANPGEVVGSQRMQNLLTELAQGVDLVLIDSPPVLPVADAAVLAPLVDGVLLVLEAGETRRQAAEWATESLRQVGARVIGVVLNRVPTHGSDGYYYAEQMEKRKVGKRVASAWAKVRDLYRERA